MILNHARKNYSGEFRRQAVDFYEGSTPGTTVRGIAEDPGFERGTRAGTGSCGSVPARRLLPTGP